MSRDIYVPIADSFFESSIMQEDLSVRFVMLALIRLSLRPGANGTVDVDLRTFAGAIVMPVEDVERAIRRLMEPDPTSSSQLEDGRRIVALNPDRPLRGWRLVNWPKYQGIVHRANDAARKREERSHTPQYSTDNTDTSENVLPRPETSGESENGATNTNTKNEERRTKNEDEKKRERGRRFAHPSIAEITEHAKGLGYENFDSEAFFMFYESKGWVVGKSPMRSWKAAVVSWHKHDGDFGRSSEKVKTATSSENHYGLRLGKDGASVSFNGDWYRLHRDGKRWLTEDSYRPDGTSIMADARDMGLNERLYAAMSAFIPARVMP